MSIYRSACVYVMLCMSIYRSACVYVMLCMSIYRSACVYVMEFVYLESCSLFTISIMNVTFIERHMNEKGAMHRLG